MERASQITVTRPLSLLRRQLPRRVSLKNCLSIRERWRRRRWRGLRKSQSLALSVCFADSSPEGGAFKTSLSLRERWRRRRWRGLVLLKLFVYINYYNIFLHINQRYIKLCIINLRFKSFFRKNFKKTIDKCVLLLYNILCCQVDLSAKIKYSSIAQLVEHSAVNRRVVGSSPTGGATSEQVLLVPIFLSKKSITRSTVPPSHKKSRCRYHLFVIMRLRRNVACFFN